MLEKTIEAYLCRRVRALGGEVRKVKWIGRKGAPDRLVMLPRSWIRGNGVIVPPDAWHCEGAWFVPPKTIWVELKAPGKKPEPHQAREHKRMHKMGQRVEVIDSFEGVDALLS